MVEAAKNYAQEDILKSSSFLNKAQELGKKIGAANNPEILENAKNLLKQGVNMAASHIGLLPAFSNTDNRAEIVEKLKQDKVEGAWIDVLANWNVQSDPYGIDALRKCREKDIEELLARTKDAKDAQEEAQIRLQAEAIGNGQDLILSYYAAQAESSGEQKAA